MFVKYCLGGRILPTGLSLFGWHTKAVLRSGAAAMSAAGMMTSAATTPASLFISNKFREGRCVCFLPVLLFQLPGVCDHRLCVSSTLQQ